MRIIHNVTKGLERIMELYTPMMSKLKPVCSLLAGRETKQQLIETCFSEGPAGVYQDLIKSFTAIPHEHRWNSIAAAIEELHELQPVLKQHWNLAVFLGSKGAPSVPRLGDPGGSDLGVNLALVDSAIPSDYFWGSLTVMLRVAQVQREAVKWVNSCSCHSHWEHSELQERRECFQSCPLEGVDALNWHLVLQFTAVLV